MARVLVALLAAAVLAPAAPAAASDIIVRREPGLDAAQRADVRADAGAKLVNRLSLPDTEVVHVAAGATDAAVRKLEADPRVRYAEPDGRVHATAVGLDPLFQWDLSTVHAAEAWGLSTGAAVTVAVVDTGIDAAHEDLAGQIAPGGHDYVDGDNVPDDENGHGTHVSGTIAAIRGNAIGVAGLAPDAKILPLRVLDADGAGFDSDVAQAFNDAGDEGVRVVNASLGGPDFSAAIRDAIARHPNTLYVVAAGNDHQNVDNTPDFPCALPQPNIICVGATTTGDNPASFSNFGATNVDVFAPGTSILSTGLASDCGQIYCTMTGTSMASPHVAAVAALLAASTPSASSAQIKQAILDGAQPLKALKGLALSGGRLDALGALTALAAAGQPATTPTTTPAPPAPAPAPAPTPVPVATPSPVATPATPQVIVVNQPAATIAVPAPARIRAARTVRKGRRTVVVFDLTAATTVRAALRGQGTQTFMTITGIAGTNRVTLPRRPRGRYTLRLVPLNGGRRGTAVSLRLTLR